MQSTEDRLTSVERQLAILTRAMTEQQLSIKDIEKNETILLGLVTSQNEDIRLIKERLDTMQGRMDSMQGRMDSMDTKLDRILALLEGRP
jgi:chromosome segregation ATPase